MALKSDVLFYLLSVRHLVDALAGLSSPSYKCNDYYFTIKNV